MGFALEVARSLRSLCPPRWASLGWSRSERDARDGSTRSGPLRRGLQAWPSRSCPLRPELYGPFSSPASRHCGRFVLAFHIVLRTARGGDDPRYRQLRAEWGDKASGRLFWFLQVQAAAGLVLALVDRCSGSSARNPARPSRRTGRRAFCGCGLRRKSGGSATGPLRGRPQE